VPYVDRPPEVTPGRSVYYATSAARDGYAVGLLAETREGRPIKVEGHPAHPMSLGATGIWEQASPYALYDPDRIKDVTHRGAPASWGRLARAFAPGGEAPHGPGGEGLHLWLRPTTSPLTVGQLTRLRARLPHAHVHFDPSAAPLARWEGARRMYGEALEAHFDFARAEVVLALDADFLGAGPASLRWARDFARRRRLGSATDPAIRLYAVGPLMEVTSAQADHRWMVPAGAVHRVAAALLAEVARHLPVPSPLPAALPGVGPREDEAPWIRAAAENLVRHRGRAAVVVGDHQPPEVHVIGHALNEVVGAMGATTWLAPSPMHDAHGAPFDPEPLLQALEAGEVRTLVLGEGNPAYAAPFRERFARLVPRAREVVHLSTHRNETSRLATWIVPQAHDLEAWGDRRAYDGTWTLIQPAIRPLHGGRTVDELLALLEGEARMPPRLLLERAWREGPMADAAPEDTLAHGFVPGSTFAPLRREPRWDAAADALGATASPEEGVEVVVRPDFRVRAGQHANVPLLHECPDPLSRIVWDNAAHIDPRTAARLGVKRGDVVRLEVDGRAVELPAYVMPGQAVGVVGVSLGYGRTGDETVARGVGVDVGPLRSPEHPWGVPNASVTVTGQRRPLVSVQMEDWHHDRGIIRDVTLADWRARPELPDVHVAHHPSLYRDRLEGAPQWAMAIDLNACTGCAACVVACQVENNVPVVGKGQVGMRREMHWLRIDRYFSGDPAHPRMHTQPMLCQHCEKAPCEYVCPVNATTHSPDGLNEMTYNRCVGTRFCSNNCPYKIRRFNYFEWNGNVPETLKMMKNPDVTVRARGVIEKCTFCVQRIRRAQIEAKVEGQPHREVEVRTACQQVCPSGAITFGSLTDREAQVVAWNDNPRAYRVLEDLGTRPRVTYLAQVHNRNREVT
jgi:Fe-S-cluster-containing dehydrogenase component